MSKPISRSGSIDAFRGFAVIGMVLVNYAAQIKWIPAVFKHAPDIGLTVADFVAPFFIFAIGLTYRPSFERRMAQCGYAKAAGQFAARYLAIAGIGAIIAAGTPLTGETPNWGVLQAIGAAGLICILFIRLGVYARIAAGLVILMAYQLALDAWMLPATLASSHGGLFGSVSWAAMLLLSTALADMLRQSKKKALFFSLLFLAAGAALSLLFPVSKNRVSASYVLVTLAAGALLFLLFDGLFGRAKSGGLLAWWGANPLLLYVLHLLLLGLIVLPGISAWYPDVSMPVAALQTLLLLGILTLIARLLYKKAVFIRL